MFSSPLLRFFFSLPKDKDGDGPPELTADEPLAEALEDAADKSADLVYALNDRPPWYLCILLGFQVDGEVV